MDILHLPPGFNTTEGRSDKEKEKGKNDGGGREKKRTKLGQLD